jgi:cytochrome c-type biogenesis protein CcmH/NrfG
MSLNESDPVTAIEACKKATELQPRNSSHWFILGLTYVTEDKGSLAVPALEQAVQIKPDFAQAWSTLADAYSLIGDQKRSSDARRRAADLKATNESPNQKDDLPLSR